MFKRYLAAILSILTILTAITVIPASAAKSETADTGAQTALGETGWSIPSETTFATRLQQLKEKYYPNGYSGAYYENGQAYAWQCYGYAVQMLHDVFGIKYYADSFYNHIDYNMGDLYAGDIVRIRGDSHSIFLTRITDKGYYFTDANWDYNNGVRWDAFFTKEEMAATFTYKIHVDGNLLMGGGDAKNGLYSEAPVLKNIKCSAPGITVYWSPIEEAAAYRVYYKEGDQKNWKTLGKTDKTYYQYINELEYGKEYTFTVRALDCYGELISGYDKEGISTKYLVAPPELKSVKADVDKITVTWAGVKGVSYYRVYAKAENDEHWHTIANVKGESCEFTKGKGHTSYQFTVRCLSNKKNLISGCSIKKLSAEYISYDTQLETPGNIAAAVTTTPKVAKITWDAVPGASRYQVFVSRFGVNNGWKKIGVATKNVFYYKNCENASNYRFTVRCIDSKGAFMSGFVPGPVFSYFDIPTKLNAVKQDDDGNIKVSWDAVKLAPAYALYYKTATSGGWQRVNPENQITGTSYVFGGCENGVKYTFTVRVCSEIGKNLSSFNTAGVSLTYESEVLKEDMTEQEATEAELNENNTENVSETGAPAVSDLPSEPQTDAPVE